MNMLINSSVIPFRKYCFATMQLMDYVHNCNDKFLFGFKDADKISFIISSYLCKIGVKYVNSV